MSRAPQKPTESGRQFAHKLRSHPGRLREILRTEHDTWSAVSLPLAFLAGLSFESFFATHAQRGLESLLNVVTVVCILGWAVSRIRRHTLKPRDPLLWIGSLVLLLGAIGCLFQVFDGDVGPEIMLKTTGAVMILFALDRMERRVVVDLLRNSEEYLESVFESIPDPLVVIGEGRRIVAANRVAIATFGEKILGETCCESYLRHVDCRECTVEQAWQKRKPRFELVRDERGVRRYEVTTFPLFGPHGFSGKLVQQIRDVSAHAESEDRASLLHDVVNSVRDPVLTLGLRGELRHQNRAAEAAFGVRPEGGSAPSGGDVLPFARPEDRESFVRALREFTPWEHETQLLSRDSQERTVVLALAPIRALDDRLLGTVVLVRDVTDLKRLQAQLTQNEKLSALGEMVSGVAHELNNPLTAVFGFAQLLLEDDLPKETKDQVRHIFTHAERCKHIIDGLLKFARRHKAEKHRANLNEVVEATVELLGYQLKISSVTVETELDPNLPDSRMDSFQIQQVLINLLSNAQYAIQEKRAPGHVRIRTRCAGNESMVVEVEDDGTGMPDHVARRIFDPFFTTKGVGKGTGLGLSISYGIVREHGGTLAVSSRLGEGSTFRMVLPVVPDLEAAAAESKSASAPACAPARILVVDDEAVILDLLGTCLRCDGHTVVACGSAQDALEQAAQADFDLVISDWRMPRMGGEEFYDALVEHRPDYRHRFIFLTGDSLGSDVARAAKRTGNAVLNKPFTIESIRRAIGKVCAPVETVEPVEPIA